MGLYSIELDKMRLDWGFCSIRKDKISYGKKLYGWGFILLKMLKQGTPDVLFS